MNSLADGAHASLLQKSCSQAICSFCPVHTLFFFFLLSVSFLCRQRTLLASVRNQNGASIHTPILLQQWLWCSSDGRSPLLLVLRGFCPEAVPNVAEANSNHCCWSQLQNEALEEFDIVSICWSHSSGAGVNTTHMFCFSLCSLCQFCSLVLPKICSTERKVRQMLTTPFKV